MLLEYDGERERKAEALSWPRFQFSWEDIPSCMPSRILDQTALLLPGLVIVGTKNDMQSPRDRYLRDFIHRQDQTKGPPCVNDRREAAEMTHNTEILPPTELTLFVSLVMVYGRSDEGVVVAAVEIYIQ